MGVALFVLNALNVS